MSDYSNLIEKYISTLKQDPQSRVFAPLGEIYRKLGLIDKAIAAYEAGLKFNPEYNLGIIGYSSCLIDMGDFKKAYSVLQPLVRSSGDNIKFLKNIAICAENVGDVENALKYYKTILFFNPRDTHATEFVTKYEDLNTTVIKKDVVQFEVDSLESDGLDEWTQLSLVEESNVSVEEGEKDDEDEDESRKADESPFFSHTLVDLYLKQGAKDKALEILEKALELNPEDTRVADRIIEIKAQLTSSTGHDDLMSLFDQKASKIVEVEDDNSEKLKMAYELFLAKIHARANEITLK
ncbi:lipopolysaccharide assembly protein LapB [Bacteriovorax sp. Seq25_V]|uniref:tetratricopeptide repeat protein n=1 Tax=Bacteriovorax sp. Seq25_V TaxID=1201288 RepID=UPI00038A52A7|nr:tetratricopeptide repeat protein [Bacteriovorax sp. Seq25_V]EQC43342.1 tetratricopeptide repeat protein [Bacteriovorax sp. Seq25_V]